eukprot:12384740-Ditylum_brightwellii.AAC.1
MEYQHCGIESLLCKDLTQQIKACKNLWRKHKADDTMPTKPAGKRKFYCDMHGHNRNHNTEDCFELKQHAKHSKPNMGQNKTDK